MKTTVDLQSLRYLISVADHGSFRKAAAAMRIRQSVISRRVRSLEDAIGVSFFERYSGGVRLTHAGVDFVDGIRRAIKDIDSSVSAAGVAGRGRIGKLAVGIYVSLSNGELRETLREFVRLYPDVSVTMIERPGSRLVTGLKNHEIDVAFASTKFDYGGTDEKMVVWSERIMVALPEAHPLVSRYQIFWPDLQAERIILSLRDPGPEIHRHLIAQINAHGDSPTIVHHDVSQENILSIVSAGRGISLLHECGTGVKYPGVIYRDICDKDGPARVNNFAYWNHANDNPVLRRFLSLLRERYFIQTRP